jgi:hypothetical protein
LTFKLIMQKKKKKYRKGKAPKIIFPFIGIAMLTYLSVHKTIALLFSERIIKKTNRNEN